MAQEAAVGYHVDSVCHHVENCQGISETDQLPDDLLTGDMEDHVNIFADEIHFLFCHILPLAPNCKGLNRHTLQYELVSELKYLSGVSCNFPDNESSSGLEVNQGTLNRHAL